MTEHDYLSDTILIETTEKYLGIEQDLTDATCAHLEFRVGGLLPKSAVSANGLARGNGENTITGQI